jgi:hypothetical protein
MQVLKYFYFCRTNLIYHGNLLRPRSAESKNKKMALFLVKLPIENLKLIYIFTAHIFSNF